jgi:hypothetical protein
MKELIHDPDPNNPDANGTTSTLQTRKALANNLVKEYVNLEHQGILDLSAMARVRAQLLLDLEAIDPDKAHEFRQRKDRYHPRIKSRLLKRSAVASPNSLARWVVKIAIFFILFILPGALLHFSIGRSFMFRHSTAYWPVMAGISVVSVPLLSFALWKMLQASPDIATQYPTRWLRDFILFPGAVIIMIAMVMLAPLGWFALAAPFISSESTSLPGRVLSVRQPHKHWHNRRMFDCEQSATVTVDNMTGEVCLDGRIIGTMPKVGDAVVVTGRPSSLGLFIDTLNSVNEINAPLPS